MKNLRKLQILLLLSLVPTLAEARGDCSASGAGRGGDSPTVNLFKYPMRDLLCRFQESKLPSLEGISSSEFEDYFKNTAVEEKCFDPNNKTEEQGFWEIDARGGRQRKLTHNFAMLKKMEVDARYFLEQTKLIDQKLLTYRELALHILHEYLDVNKQLDGDRVLSTTLMNSFDSYACTTFSAAGFLKSIQDSGKEAFKASVAGTSMNTAMLENSGALSRGEAVQLGIMFVPNFSMLGAIQPGGIEESNHVGIDPALCESLEHRFATHSDSWWVAKYTPNSKGFNELRAEINLSSVFAKAANSQGEANYEIIPWYGQCFLKEIKPSTEEGGTQTTYQKVLGLNPQGSFVVSGPKSSSPSHLWSSGAFDLQLKVDIWSPQSLTMNFVQSGVDANLVAQDFNAFWSRSDGQESRAAFYEDSLPCTQHPSGARICVHDLVLIKKEHALVAGWVTDLPSHPELYFTISPLETEVLSTTPLSFNNAATFMRPSFVHLTDIVPFLGTEKIVVLRERQYGESQ